MLTYSLLNRTWHAQYSRNIFSDNFFSCWSCQILLYSPWTCFKQFGFWRPRVQYFKIYVIYIHLPLSLWLFSYSNMQISIWWNTNLRQISCFNFEQYLTALPDDLCCTRTNYSVFPLDKIILIRLTTIFKCTFVNDKFCIAIRISLKLVPKGSIHSKLALVQVMAWRRIGDKSLPGPTLIRFTDAYMRF